MWGPVTATLDWCEANYQFSQYIAEVANTFSNLFSIAVAVYGARRAIKQSLPARYVAGFTGFALVGIGSFAFHATLLYEAQLADELPMIYLASYISFVLLETEPGYGLKSTYSRVLLAMSLLFDGLFTLSYYLYRNPVYHQVVFASLMLATGLRAHYLRTWSEASRRLPDRHKDAFLELFIGGAGLFLLGFLIWNLDNIFCDTLTRWKNIIGWPLAFLLEGHSWWHVLTGSGSYFLLQGVAYRTLCIKDDRHNYQTSRWLGLPLIYRTEKAKAT
ncbi:alkaline phytoceramidase [Artomyces pyxidatus]|uniref:Alkaline phytoceramidase n=1 Tax=Artomyces pyxidatus TaxID=48021 RepID=A0ACB8SU89_9AGAM|nr:alkaline phytoceramidase [Artomyces pyxidatus]